MEYNFKEIEKKWQAYWSANQSFKTDVDASKPKFYVLDMFPYPSGAGLHVGHPLGYIASDIYSRYKRLRGYNVLHPMGYDAFGLPAEQYAIQTGQHPAITTEKNIDRYREQLDRIGFSYDWSREVRTCDPAYYKWTQWAFLKMFASWYDKSQEKARPIEELEALFAQGGSAAANAACSEELVFSAEQWAAYSECEKADVLMNYRIAYQGETSVNWCAGLGTVLANDEVKDGLSVRGGFPVEQKKMLQWQLRVSAYAGRLLDDLGDLDWTDSLKDMQRNWIGRSQGAEMVFKVQNGEQEYDMTIFTTRADTVFGVTFMVLAPESEWVEKLTTSEQAQAVADYLEQVKKKTERERIAQTRNVTGVFSGSYAINPLTGDKVPVWISEYVLSGYGTGAIMAVPAHDSRDYAFAKHFSLPIIPLIKGCDVSEQSFDAKEGIMCNSGFLNGMTVKEAIPAAIDYVEKEGAVKSTIVCVMPFSHVSVIGVSLSLCISRMAWQPPWMRVHCLWNCLLSETITNRPRAVNLLWPVLKIGRLTDIRLKKVPCPVLPVRVPTICVIWILTTIRHLSVVRRMSIGEMSICISVEPNMQPVT